MAVTKEYVSEKYKEVTARVVREEKEWKRFLKTAARLYRYNFEDQLLIFAQRPGARMCGEMEDWNRVHCRVGRGEKGIGLFDRSGNRKSGLRYVFDISEVYRERGIGRYPPSWWLTRKNRESVLNHLEDIYGETDRDKVFEERLMDLAQLMAAEVTEDALLELAAVGIGDETMETGLSDLVEETIASSISYMLLSRCNCNPDKWEYRMNFSLIGELHTPELLSAVGNVISESSKEAFIAIRTAIGELENGSRDILRTPEKKLVKGLENVQGQRYNVLKNEKKRSNIKESQDETEQAIPIESTQETNEPEEAVQAKTIQERYEQETTGQKEGAKHDENGEKYDEHGEGRENSKFGGHHRDSDRGRRRTGNPRDDARTTESGGAGAGHRSGLRMGRDGDISDSEDGSRSGTGGGVDEIRKSSDEVSAGSPERKVFGTTDEREVENPLSGDSEGSRGDGRKSRGTDGRTRGSERETEEERPAPLVGGDEQHQEPGPGDRDGGTDLRLRSIVIDLTPKSRYEAERTEQQRQATEVEKQNQTVELEEQTVDIVEQTADTVEQAVDTEGQSPDTGEQTEDTEKQPADIVEQKTDIEEQIQTADTEDDQIDQSVSAVSLSMEDKEEIAASDNTSQDRVTLDDSVSVKDSTADDYTLSDADIDRILRSAGGREMSRERIYPKYCLNYTPTYRADFLRREYDVVGKGFMVDGHRISVWFDEQGMRAGLGNSAWKNTVLVMDWTAVEKRVSQMIVSGEYLPASVVKKLEQEEKTRLAEKIINYMDMCCKINPKIKMRSEQSHTELVAFTEEVLGNDASIDTIKYALEPLEKAIQGVPVALDKNRFETVESIYQEALGYKGGWKMIPQKEDVPAVYEDFITQDEIDWTLRNGIGAKNGKLEIAKIVLEQQSDSDRMLKLLCDQFEHSPRLEALPGYDPPDAVLVCTDAGLLLQRCRISQIPVAQSRLSWEQVAERIGELLAKGSYLSGKELTEFERWQASLTSEEEKTGETLAEDETREPVSDNQTESPDHKSADIEEGDKASSGKKIDDTTGRKADGERTQKHSRTQTTQNVKYAEGFKQLSIFDMKPVTGSSDYSKIFEPMLFTPSEEQLEDILRSGGGNRGSRDRIYAKYAAGKDAVWMRHFLRREYGTTGKGFLFDGKEVAVWFSEEGMRVDRGMTALGRLSHLYNWEDVEQIIRKMVENGTYLTQLESQLLPEKEYRRVANRIWNFLRDGLGGVPEPLGISGNGYQEFIEGFSELAEDGERRNLLIDILHKGWNQITSGEIKPRFRVPRADILVDEIEDLVAMKFDYPLAEKLVVRREDFITQDEIDTRLKGRSTYKEGEYHIYEFFTADHEKKERINLLKREFGMGGSSSALIGNDFSHDSYDAKGIRLEKGDYGNPYVSVLLKWDQVERIIRRLIAEDRYLTEEEKSGYQNYLEKKQERARKEQAKNEERRKQMEYKDTVTQAVREHGVIHVAQVEKRGTSYDPVADAREKKFINDTIEYDPEKGKIIWRADSVTNMGEQQEGLLLYEFDAVDPEGNRMDDTWIAERIVSLIAEKGFVLQNVTYPYQEEIQREVTEATETAETAEPTETAESEEAKKENLQQDEIKERDYDNTRESQAKREPPRTAESGEKTQEAETKREPPRTAESGEKTQEAETKREPPHTVESGEETQKPEVKREPPHTTESGEEAQGQGVQELLEEGQDEAGVSEIADDLQGQIDLLEDENEAYRSLLGRSDIPRGEKLSYRDKMRSNADQIRKLKKEMSDRKLSARKEHDEERVDDKANKEADSKAESKQDDTAGSKEGSKPDGEAGRDGETEQILTGVVEDADGHVILPDDYGAIEEAKTTEDSVDFIASKYTLGEFPIVEAETVRQQERRREDTNAHNFHITDNLLGVGGKKLKYQRNVKAIRTAEQILREGRTANPEEQQTLSEYVGWGGLSEVFDEKRIDWEREYAELKELLPPEEYDAARRSTLNAHYTTPVIIRGVYETLQRMGFESGNILEPSMGVGNFFGMLPESMQESRLYGVELDATTGKLAKLLYPGADIQIKGFEKTDFENDFFDVAVGNVPFGDYHVSDRAYDKMKLSIHDYFFVKSLDKVRPGGMIAFLTSSWTMDKKEESVRRYLSQRAEFLGAVRLPNDAFEANAGTRVTIDILFLKKRDRIVDLDEDWIHLDTDANGISMNRYFVLHPEQLAGEMKMISSPYGMKSACVPGSGVFEEVYVNCLSGIEGSYEVAEVTQVGDKNRQDVQTLPADPSVRNFSYTLVDGEIYFRENSVMTKVSVQGMKEKRIRGMIGLRDCTYELIHMQMEDRADEEIMEKQAELNRLYDDFFKKYGMLNSVGNKQAFDLDCGYCLLCSLEELDDERNYVGKADMFTKRTIRRAEVVTSVDTAVEALAVSLAEKAGIDFAYMQQLSGKSKEEIVEELKGVIFHNPLTDDWETGDEYLSGNVRRKLSIARSRAEEDPEYQINVEALERVQPKALDASEIEVRLGATWVDAEYIADFMREVLQTPEKLLRREIIGVTYTKEAGKWKVFGKNADYGNAMVYTTYGTDAINGYEILEHSLNLKDVRIYKTVETDGVERRVVDQKETMIAQQKQDALKGAFREWIFRDQKRREILVAKYNRIFNSTRPREYDGAHLKFPGMSPDINLKDYQKNAIAHILYGKNTLIAHCVGAGKTFCLAAAAMELRRLGICRKSMFVVPNHLTEQWAAEFLKLYPGAKILAAKKKDFAPMERKKFCSRIATGDYDAVIIGHTQFEKIPLSPERQAKFLREQIEEITQFIEDMKTEEGKRYSIKEMEKTKARLEERIKKLTNEERKDNVVTFEQIGVDHIFVDESQAYKNLFLYTKINNVAGISQTESQRSQDMFNKCRYLDELTGSRGVTFATGTPISNSVTELYTVMRYLMRERLIEQGLGQFDDWASTFGEISLSIELAPEGNSYRTRTRFSKFYNLPELVALFKETADIQTADMLQLPVPEADYEDVVLKPSEEQKEVMQTFVARAEAIRGRRVSSDVDNMLKVTNDGRKLALDQRLYNPSFPETSNNKINACVEKAFSIWEDTMEQKSAQLLFCDLSTPKGRGEFNVYDEIRKKLIERGVPEKEIAFIHQANTDTQKADLFAKVRSGQVRFLLGSTQKMGAGTNVQTRLIALHHLDVPWRPSDIEQQEGRILRQGNQNKKVKIFRYITTSSFDAYSWQILENKQKIIGQIMTGKSPLRSCDDVDGTALDFAEVKAIATDNPMIREKMELDLEVHKLSEAKKNHTRQIYRLEDNITKNYPRQISSLESRIKGLETDISGYRERTSGGEDFAITLLGRTYTERKDAGEAMLEIYAVEKLSSEPKVIGEYMGFAIETIPYTSRQKEDVWLRGAGRHGISLSEDAVGNMVRLKNVLEKMEPELLRCREELENVKRQLEVAKEEVKREFPQEQELSEKTKRLSELNIILNMETQGEQEQISQDTQDEIRRMDESVQREQEAREEPEQREMRVQEESEPSKMNAREESEHKEMRTQEASVQRKMEIQEVAVQKRLGMQDEREQREVETSRIVTVVANRRNSPVVDRGSVEQNVHSVPVRRSLRERLAEKTAEAANYNASRSMERTANKVEAL